jgi:hypothetical protein
VLTGKPPVTARHLGELLHKVQHGDVTPPRYVQAAVPPALEAACLKAMALRPEHRYTSALGVAADVEHWLADEPVAAFREPWHARVRRWGRRHRQLVVGAAAALFMAVILLVVMMVQSERARQAVVGERDRTVAARLETRHVLDSISMGVAMQLLEAHQELIPQFRGHIEQTVAFCP